MMIVMYKRWIKEGWMTPIQSQGETEFIVNILLATASTFLQFFESAEKIPARKHIEVGKRYVAWLLMPWTAGSMREQFQSFIFSRTS
jgi:hypothetical protein